MMKRYKKGALVILSGVVLVQLGGCGAAMLADIFFAIGPLLL